MHRTEGVDYTTEEGKRRYIDPNLPSVRGTVLNAESMNAIQEEICNVIEKAGLTLNTTAAADRADGWDQLWEAITDRGIIGEAALDSGLTAILNVLRYGISAYGNINPSEVGPCYTRIAIIPKVEFATRMVSGRITHIGGDFPWNSCGIDFMLEQRDSNIVAYKQKLRVFTTPGATDGTLYYRDVDGNIEIWAFCTASFPRIVGTMYPNGNQYWNPNAGAEWTATDPTGLTQFTDIAEDVIPDGSVLLASLSSEVNNNFALASDLSTLASDLSTLSSHVDTYQRPGSHTTIQVWSDAAIATIPDTSFVENGMLTIELGNVATHQLTGDVWQVAIALPTSDITTQYIRIKGSCVDGIAIANPCYSTVNVIINDYYHDGGQISIPVIMPYNNGAIGFSPVIKLVKISSYWTVA